MIKLVIEGMKDVIWSTQKKTQNTIFLNTFVVYNKIHKSFYYFYNKKKKNNKRLSFGNITLM